jgi:hypothetical protein
MFSPINLAIAFGLSLGMSMGPPDPTRTFERLNGFDTVVVTEVNRTLGTERLPAANGYPIEPGMYVTVSSSQMTVYDRVAASLNAGMATDRAAAPECQSGCPAALYDAFRRAWMDAYQEESELSIDVATRVLFGVDAQLPARALVDAAYAASEARPGAPPALYMLFNGGPAGLRARPFFLLPPKGLRTPPGSSQLGLRVTAKGSDQYQVKASTPGFAPIDVASAGQLKAVLADIAKRYPSKSVIVIDVEEAAYVYDVVAVMIAAQEHFTSPVLGLGQPLVVR